MFLETLLCEFWGRNQRSKFPVLITGVFPYINNTKEERESYGIRNKQGSQLHWMPSACSVLCPTLSIFYLSDPLAAIFILPFLR